MTFIVDLALRKYYTECDNVNGTLIKTVES